MLLGTQDTPDFPRDLREKFTFLKREGFDCFEMDGGLLLERQKELPELIRETELPVCSGCNGYRGWIGDIDEERRQQGISDLREMLRVLSSIGADGMVVPAAYGMCTNRLPGRHSPRSAEEDREILLDSLGALDEKAGREGVCIFLEPLNRFADHMINTVGQAVDLIKAGRFSHVKVTFDFYHLSMEEDSLSGTISRYGSYIGRVHLSENHRYQPGTGSVDFRTHLSELREAGYDGPVVIESMIRPEQGETPLAAYLKSASYVRSLLPA